MTVARDEFAAMAAACLMGILQREGAVFTITADGYLNVDLDPVPFPCGDCGPHDMIRIVLALTEEFKQLMRAESIVQ